MQLTRRISCSDVVVKIAEAYIAIKKAMPSLIAQDIDEIIEVRRVYVGPRKQGALVELVSKKKGISCSECVHFDCFMKSIGEGELVENGRVDLDFIASNSYSMAGLIFQEDAFELTGDSLWSPIVIR